MLLVVVQLVLALLGGLVLGGLVLGHVVHLLSDALAPIRVVVDPLVDPDVRAELEHVLLKQPSLVPLALARHSGECVLLNFLLFRLFRFGTFVGKLEARWLKAAIFWKLV